MVIWSGVMAVPGVWVVMLQTPAQAVLLPEETVWGLDGAVPPAEKHSLPALSVSPRTRAPAVIEAVFLVSALKLAKVPEPTIPTMTPTTIRLIRTRWPRPRLPPRPGRLLGRAGAAMRTGIAAGLRRGRAGDVPPSLAGTSLRTEVGCARPEPGASISCIPYLLPAATAARRS